MRNPIRGLLMYSYYASKKKVASVVFFALTVGTGMMILGDNAPFNISFIGENSVFGIAMGIILWLIPYSVLAMSEDTTKWERYQVAMPVQRKHLVAALYLAVVLSLIVAFAVIGVIAGLGLILHNNMWETITTAEILSFVIMGVGMPLLMAALLYPLAMTKFGNNNQPTIFMISMFGTIAAFLGCSWLFRFLDLPDDILKVLTLFIGVVPFIISYFITKKLYEKDDF